MEKCLLSISNHPPEGEEWNEAWEGEASTRYLEVLKANFEYVGFKTYIQLIILENTKESKMVKRIFSYKIFLKKPEVSTRKKQQAKVKKSIKGN
jgi:hypothetical protein